MAQAAEKISPVLEVAPPPALPWRAAFVLSLLLATVAGFSAGGAGVTATAPEPELGRMLQFMAAVKGLMSLAFAGAIVWRFGRSTPAGLALLYVTSGVMLFAAPGLIWQLGHVALGALLFHAGLFTFLAALAMDGGAKERLGATLAARGSARSGAP